MTILSTKKLRPAIHTACSQQDIIIIDDDFIDIEYLSVSEENFISLNEYLVFTSQHGVKGFINNTIAVGLDIGPRKIFCLQGETLRSTEALDNTDVIAIAANAMELAKIIVSIEEVKAVSFLCGSRRRDELSQILKQHEVEVQEIEVYKTLITGSHVTTGYDGVLFFSPSAVESFFQKNKLKKNIPCFCIGNTTKNAVAEYSGNELIVASEPTQESILSAATNYFIQKRNQQIHE